MRCRTHTTARAAQFNRQTNQTLRQHMKKILTAILTSFGLRASSDAASPSTSIDVKSIRYSEPTVAADAIAFVMPTRETFEDAPQFHEDAWCQIEFFAASRLPEIKTRLTELESFEKRHRTRYGWTDIYARRLERTPMTGGPDALSRLEEALPGKRLPSPILTTTSQPLGQVKDGFTLRLGDTGIVYGIATNEGLVSLGAMVEPGGDDAMLTKAFVALNQKFQFSLVDWRTRMVLVSVDPVGDVRVWRP
jgi:hypothetical protein